MSTKILFLSDCYLEGICWGTFHLSLIRNLAAVSDSLLAIRTNSFFDDGSIRPISEDHLSSVTRSISKFQPDIVFSVNHSGLTKDTLKVIPKDAKIITLFIDFYGRCPEELRSFSKKDFIWGTGMGAIKDNFVFEYKDVLDKDQIEFTLWGADTTVFYPLRLERDLDVSFIGSAYNFRPFSELIEAVSVNEKNREILIDLYLDHRKEYIFDLAKELRLRKFDFTQVSNKKLRVLTTNSRLQTVFSDQISSEQRIQYLASLKDMKMEVYGEPKGIWIDLISSCDAKLLSHFKFRAVHENDELAMLYNRSKIGLNVQIDHAREAGLSFRVFDIMACKALLMTPLSSKVPLESLGFKENDDFICFSTPEELKQKCSYFVDHTEERNQIVESALLKLKTAHTFRHRLASVFSKAGLSAVSEKFGALSDQDINDELYDTKIWFLDLYGKKRKYGRDFDPLTRYEIDHNIPAGQLTIQLDSFRLGIRTDLLPIPSRMRSTTKQVLKYVFKKISKNN